MDGRVPAAASAPPHFVDGRVASAPQKTSWFTSWFGSAGKAAKQAALHAFGASLNGDVNAHDLHLGLLFALNHASEQGELSDGAWNVCTTFNALMEHRNREIRYVTHSAAVAICALVVRMFGSYFFTDGEWNWDRIEMALQFLIGKYPHVIADIERYYRASFDGHQTAFTLNETTRQVTVRFSHYACTFNLPLGQVTELPAILSDEHWGHCFIARKTQVQMQVYCAALGIREGAVHNALQDASGKTTPTERTFDLPGITASRALMTAGRVFYDRTVSGVQIRLIFEGSNPVLLNHAPPAVLRELGDAALQDPVNFYKMVLSVGAHRVEAYCSGAFGAVQHGLKRLAIEHARRVLTTVFSTAAAPVSVAPLSAGEETPVSPPIMVDLRFLRMYAYGGFGKDPRLYKEHWEALQAAARELGIDVYSLYLHVATKSYETHFNPFPKGPPEEPRKMLDALKSVLGTRFSALPEEIKSRYHPFFTKWLQLTDGLRRLDNAIPFAALTLFLQDVLGFRVLMGCRSAKDRTGAILSGVNMLLPLLFAEFNKGAAAANLNRLFRAEDGHLNWDRLSPAERMQILSIYDEKLLHTPNFVNLGVYTNIGSLTLEAFYDRCPVVAHTHLRTVGVRA